MTRQLSPLVNSDGKEFEIFFLALPSSWESLLATWTVMTNGRKVRIATLGDRIFRIITSCDSLTTVRWQTSLADFT